MLKFALSVTETVCLRNRQAAVVCSRRGTRRTTTPPSWVVQKYAAYKPQFLTDDNEQFLREINEKKLRGEGLFPGETTSSPLVDEPWPREQGYPGVKRCGLITRKLGVMPQWTLYGKRILTTMLQVLDNRVINYFDAETWNRQSIVGKKRAYNRRGVFGKLTVGAIAADPQQFTGQYLGIFEKAGVPPMKRLASFMVHHEARIQPGTRLYATHFKCGQYVDVSGRSIDWGFQGAVHRWGFKGQPKTHGVTKAHRSHGSTGSTGDKGVLRGKRMAGHMGWEWVHTRGVKILRIDVKNQVIYVKGGSCPGDPGELLQVKDSYCKDKLVENPPFPTHYPDEEDQPLPIEYFDPLLHQFKDPTIMYQEAADDGRSKVKLFKKQAKARGGTKK